MLPKTTAIFVVVVLLVGCSGKSAKAKGEFLSGCVQSGTAKSVCTCVYDHLEDTYSPETLQALAESPSAFPDSTIQAISRDTGKYAAMCLAK
jgi:hypothetical protein